MRRLPLLLLLAACCGVPALTDEAVIPGESKPMGTRLEEARKALNKKEPARALKLLQSVLEGGTELVALKDGRSVRARWLANAALARLDADTLKTWRDRAEPAAKKLLTQANEDRDPALWRRIVDEAFCTKSALVALDALGDRAFQRGRFDEACEWWSLIASLGGGRKKDDPDDLLLYPDPTDEQAARARAKQLLARLFRGGDGTLTDDLARFRKMHPTAKGRLAGKDGLYVERLAAVAKERAADTPDLDDDWTTFGGNSARSRVAAAPPKLLDQLSQLCRPGPTWRFDLQTRKKLSSPLAVNPSKEVTRARSMAFYPVIVGRVALVADHRRVVAYDLKTGKVGTWYDAADYFRGINKAELTLPAPAEVRYTLTVAEDCVYARLGTRFVRDVRPGDKKQHNENTQSLLVCLGLEPNRDGERRRWTVQASDAGRKDYAVFEGAPLVADGRVYIAATRFEGDKVITAIHCYPANSEDSTPAPLWRVDVCETRELLSAEAGADLSKKRRARHHLLTLAGPRVVYCSHSGAIVAVDAFTGQRTWAVRYPRRDITDPEDAPALRDLAPCLYADGKLFAAPADSDRLLCLDPATGRTLWKRDHLDAVHLLGVGQGRLILTTYRNPREGQLHAGGLRAVSADDGGDEAGWSLPDDGGGLAPLGRGLLVGDLVLWPTARKPYGVFAVRQKDGRQPDNPSLLHRLPAGNLLYANGAMIVTGERMMEVFVPPQWLDEDEEQEITSDGDSLVRGMRLARASAGRGEWAGAVKRFDAVRKAIDSPGLLGRRLLGEIRRERTEALLRLKRGKEAERDETPRGRLRVAVAAKDWDAIRKSKELRWLSVEDERGMPASAATMATRQIGERHGVDQALMRRARAHEKKKEYQKAAGLFREAMRQGDHSGMGFWPSAEGRLAHAWKELNCPVAANAVERANALRFRDKMGILWNKNAVPFLLKPKHAPRPEPAWPLVRRWQIDLAKGERLLRLEAVEGPTLDRVWSGNGRDLLCRSAETGKVVWRCTLPFVVDRLTAVGDVVIAAGPHGIAGVGPDGDLEWVFPAPVIGREPASADGIRVVRKGRVGGSFAMVGVVSGHVLCVQDRRRLLAVEGWTGRVAWQWWAPGAAFEMPFPRGSIGHVQVLDDQVLVQASGRAWLLDEEGKVRAASRPCSLEPWTRPALRVEKHHWCLVPDRDRVQLLDAETGKMVWTATMPGKTLRSRESPLVLVTQKGLRLLLPLNIGYQWYSVHRKTGQLSRLDQPLLNLDRLDAKEWVTAGPLIYQVSQEKLTARDAATGKVLWSRQLSGGASWRMEVGKELLWLWPRRAPAGRFQFRWLGGAVQWRTGALFDPTVLCVDTRTGAAVQRLNLPAAPVPWRWQTMRRGTLRPSVELGVDPHGAAGPVVQATKTGLVIGLAGRAWALGPVESVTARRANE